jgi:toxin-antitoxin system PIN domain toxin
MKLIDVNVLVQVHREDADRHLEVKAWLEEAMEQACGVAVSDLVLSGFLRIVTHPKVFKDPSPLSVALEFIEDFRGRDEVHVLSPSSGHWEIFTDLCRKTDAKGNHVPDAYHAALALETGCEWISMDRGFSRYPGLRWSLPLNQA